MIKIFAAENIQSAYLVQGMLHAAGVACRIFNEYAQGGMGELPFTHTYPEIWLENETDAAQARKIITRFELSMRQIGNHTCPLCGARSPDTFDICWQCGTKLA